MYTLITHTSPDPDALGAAWLLQRFGGLQDAVVVFVNTGAPDPAVLANAVAVVDTGREYDPARNKFDHHHLPGAAANNTCATMQVWEALLDRGMDVSYLDPLVHLIYAGDTGRRAYGADVSRDVGIHAQLSARKAAGWTDEQLRAWGYQELDFIAAHLKAKVEAEHSLATHTVYRSDDGLVVALKDAPRHATTAAHEAGARLVLFQSSTPETNSIGVMRAGEWQEPHVGALVAAIISASETTDSVREELARFYRHEAGFFSGRGTGKAPDPRPVLCDLADIARAIDAAWRR